MATAMHSTLTYLKHHHHRAAIEILFQAYQHDPMYQYVFGAEPSNYNNGLRILFQEELAVFEQNQQPIVGAVEGESLLGAAFVLEPHSPLGGNRQWNWRMRMLRIAGVAPTSRLLEKEQRINQALPCKNCHQISALAVAPEWQQQGIGETLLSGMASLVDEHPSSEGCAVFVSNPKLLPWLVGHGYQQVTSIEFSHCQGVLMYRPRRSTIRHGL